MPVKATLRTVAQAAGVSHQTVSRVFNGDPAVGKEIRDRVMRAADDQNYHPSAAARSLSLGRSDVVSFVAPYGPDSLFADPHIMEVIHGATRAVTARRRRLLLSLPSNDHERRSVIADVTAERIADAVIVEAGMGDDGFDAISRAGYPLIVVGYTTLPLASVRPDDEGGMYALAQHLLALGHRDLGLIDGPEADHLVLDARRAGITRALADAGAGRIVGSVAGDFSTESGYRAADHLMSDDAARPTTIVAVNDRMAIGAMQWLREHGLRVPQDVSVTGFDDIQAAGLADPPLTTVRVPSADLGEKAAELLLDSGLAPAPEAVVLPVQLVVRGSTAPVTS